MLSYEDAINYAIESVKRDTILPDGRKAGTIDKLNRLMKRVWYMKWDEKSIVDALKNFEKEQGRPPRVSDLKEKNMPKESTIRNIFHVEAKTLLKELFPQEKKHSNTGKSKFYRYKTEEEWLECFRTQFNKHIKGKYKNGNWYNILKDENTPSRATIEKFCKVSGWTELMAKAGVQYEVKVETAKEIKVVDATCITLEKMKKLNEESARMNLEILELLSKKEAGQSNE